MDAIDYARIEYRLRDHEVSIQGLIVPLSFWQRLVTEIPRSMWGIVPLKDGTYHQQWMGMYIRPDPYIYPYIVALDRIGDIVMIINLENFYEEETP